MKTLITTSVLLAVALCYSPAPVASQSVQIDPNRYGALAYSPKTGKYGYSWNQTSRAAAESIALSGCKADDAKLLTWVRFGWAVLVIAEDKAHGFHEVHGDRVGSKDAYDGAMKHLRKSSNAKVTTIVTICSGNVAPKIITEDKGK